MKMLFRYWLHIFGIVTFTRSSSADEDAQFQISGLFPNDSTSGIVFTEAVNAASNKLEEKNSMKLSAKLLERSEENVSNPYIIRIDVCRQLQEGIIGIFGPQAAESTSIVQSICDTKDLPHVQMNYDPYLYENSYLINLYPHPSTLAKAYACMINKWAWKSFIIVYENNESLMRISELLKPEINGGAIVRLYQLTPPDNRHILHHVRSSKETNILLDCSTKILNEVLKQAQQVGIMTLEYSYIITNLDLQTLDLEPYKYSGVNITGLRLFDPFSAVMNETVENWGLNETTQSKLETGTVLIYDAVMLFTKSIIFHSDKPNFEQKSIDCDTNDSWNSGTSIINYMRTAEIEDGLTGLVKFDWEGFRTDVELQIIELTKNDLEYVGRWNLSTGITIEKTFNDYGVHHTNIKEMKNMTFKVVIPMTNPYAMRKKSSIILTGNDQYEGYCVDLINELSRMSGFKYTFIIQEDGNIGNFNETDKTWNGMIGKVISGEADLALGDTSVTPMRTRDVDFTYQYMDLGISILYKKPEKEVPDLFSFLFPFSTDVWLLVITACIGVSLLFFIMARLSPYEWTNPYPCVEEPEVLENQFTLGNSLWFTIGALMQQGSEIAPISTSTRVAAGFWWFFTLIMVSSYTANLAAFLTVENPVSPFHNVKELANQNDIAYGLKKPGSTYTYFQESTDETYKKMTAYMITNEDEVIVKTNNMGVEKVINSNGKYAFLMESSSIEYEVQQHCELAQINGLLDNKNYAIAVRKGSWYVGVLGRDILALQEQGKLADMKRKWWKEKYTKNCMEGKKNDAETLELANVGGVFLVLIAGTIIAFFLMLIELMWYAYDAKKQQNISMKHKLIQEVHFIVKCKTVKPVYPTEKRILGESTSLSNGGAMNNQYNELNNGYTVKL